MKQTLSRLLRQAAHEAINGLDILCSDRPNLHRLIDVGIDGRCRWRSATSVVGPGCVRRAQHWMIWPPPAPLVRCRRTDNISSAAQRLL